VTMRMPTHLPDGEGSNERGKQSTCAPARSAGVGPPDYGRSRRSSCLAMLTLRLSVRDPEETLLVRRTTRQARRQKFALMLVVSAPANSKATRGWLEQSYVADRVPSDPTVRLFVGQTNRDIVLQMEANPVPGGPKISISRVDLKLTAIPASTASGSQK